MISILIVDDNAEISFSIKAHLSGNDYQITTATNAPEALSIIKKNAPDILMTDIVMPGAFDGLELARIVSAEYPKMKILLMTGWSYDDNHSFPVLHKPFELSLVTNWIKVFAEED